MSWLSLVLLLGSFAMAVTVQAAEEPEAPVIQNRTLRASDGWPIHVTYFESALKKEAPAVILLHMKGSNNLVWCRKGGLASKLQDKGYAVVAVDLRKHGKSKGSTSSKSSSRKSDDPTGLKRNDYRYMVERDLEAVKAFLLAEHQQGKLNVRKLGIVAAEMSGPIAINFAARDWVKRPYDDAPTRASATPRGQDVQALVLLSPETSCPGVLTNRSLPFLKSRRIAMLICVGGEDTEHAENGHRIFLQVGGAADTKGRLYYKEYPVKLRGTDLLGKSSIRVEELIRKFLDRNVMDLAGPRYDWRDRRSRLQ